MPAFFIRHASAVADTCLCYTAFLPAQRRDAVFHATPPKIFVVSLISSLSGASRYYAAAAALTGRAECCDCLMYAISPAPPFRYADEDDTLADDSESYQRMLMAI